MSEPTPFDRLRHGQDAGDSSGTGSDAGSGAGTEPGTGAGTVSRTGTGTGTDSGTGVGGATGAGAGTGASIDIDVDAPVAELIRLAGRRPEPAPFRAARARLAVEAEWRRAVRRRTRRSLWGLASIAAAIALLAAGAFVARQLLRAPVSSSGTTTSAPAASVATLARVVGRVDVVMPGQAVRPMHAGDAIAAGAAIDTTAGGRAALLLAGGTSLRLDAGSRLVMESASRVSLERGTVYVDAARRNPTAAARPTGQTADPSSSGSSASSGLSATAGVEVVTTHGVVREIGTQFEVRAVGSAIEVRVREGEVRVDREARAQVAVARAESVRIEADSTVERRPFPVDGSYWAWVEEIAPPFALEGASLENFLRWVSREQGWGWRFTDDDAARHGATVVLHGSIDGLTPAEALDAVLPTCGMTHEILKSELVVSLARQ